MRRLALALLSCSLPVLAAGPEKVLKIDLGGGVALEAVRIPSGTYQQGSPADEPGRGGDESPREVTLTKAFYLGKLPATRGQFERFAAETGYRTEAEKGASGGFGLEAGKLVQKKEYTWRNPGFAQDSGHPVVLVTYEDALAFCRWLEQKAGRRATLPTEAQWEFAARAFSSDPWPGAATGSGTGTLSTAPSARTRACLRPTRASSSSTREGSRPTWTCWKSPRRRGSGRLTERPAPLSRRHDLSPIERKSGSRAILPHTEGPAVPVDARQEA